MMLNSLDASVVSSADARRLRRSDFSFHGFDDQLAELDAYLDDVWIRTGAPAAATVENAVYVPAVELSRGHYEGCLVTRDGQPIPTALAHRRFGAFGNQVLGTLSQPVPIAPEHVVEEEVVYLGWYIDHFGHILLEALPRTWILDQIDPATKVVFHLQSRGPLLGFGLKILAAFGVPEDRILILDRQTLLRRVIVPETLHEISYAAHERLPDAYRQAAAKIFRGVDRSEQPLYLSRRLLSGRHRPIVGEFELEEVLRENGFLVAYPETMSFEDQIRLINRHPDIFTSAGSAAYLPLFALQPPRIHTLTAGIPFHDYFLIPKALGAEASFCRCFTGDNRPSHYYLPPMLEMDKLADYLDSIGLLKTRLRAAFTARVRDFRAEYDEQRLISLVQLHVRMSTALPAAMVDEAVRVASSSWPLCWFLAQYFVERDPDRIEPLLHQFMFLVTAESDVNRLAHFQSAIRSSTKMIMRHCSDDMRARLESILSDRLLIDVSEQRVRQTERGRARKEARAKQRATPATHGIQPDRSARIEPETG